MSNTDLVTIQCLQDHIPKKWNCFAELINEITKSANAAPIANSPFFMLNNKERQNQCILITALMEVEKVKGIAVLQWIQFALQAMASADIRELPELMKTCPDESILPLIQTVK